MCKKTTTGKIWNSLTTTKGLDGKKSETRHPHHQLSAVHLPSSNVREFEPFKLSDDTRNLIKGSILIARISFKTLPTDTNIH